MKLLLVTNASLNSEKFIRQNELLFNTAKDLNINIVTKRNTDIIYNIYNNSNNFGNYDAVLFYDKDTLLAKELENKNYKVFNSSECIKNCDNKALTYQILEKNNLPIPETYILPLIFYYNKTIIDKWIYEVEKRLSYPIIVKKWYGSEGKQVYLINNRSELDNLIEKENGNELLVQHYYEECCGKDIRINIVNGKIVAAMKRMSVNGDFRSNLSNGGTAVTYTPNPEESELAINAAKALKCDFCGVDILNTNNGPVICEVNSNAHLNNIYSVTNVNVAKHILEYIINKIG